MSLTINIGHSNPRNLTLKNKNKIQNSPPAPQKAAFVIKIKYFMKLSCWNVDHTAEIKPEYDLNYWGLAIVRLNNLTEMTTF